MSGSAGAAISGGSTGAPQAGSPSKLDAGSLTNDDDASLPAAADAGSGDAGHEPRGTGPGDWVAGDYPKDLPMQTYLEIKDVPGQAGNTRQYKVHVPPGYDPAKPMPVVFCIHGLGQNAVMFCVDGAGMPAKADAAGFILVMPNGYQSSWNAGTCCGGAATAKLDDVGLMRAIFKEVSGHLNIDLSRVYATGLSNGGYMSYRLACDAADLFVAVAPGSGAIGMDDIGGGSATTGDWAACKPSAKVSLLDFHGTADPLIPYKLQKASLERIAMLEGCKLTTHAATQPKSAGDTTCVSYDDCPSGLDITGCSVMGGGHDWFGSDNCGTGVMAACSIVGANSDTLKNTDAAWEFFSAHAR
jgi:polyhydroxybutyrate depolymerase